LKNFFFNRLFPFLGRWVGIRTAPPLPFDFEFATGVINDGGHKTILSGGILPQQNKIDIFLSDKIPYL
jgi:hypothetical protein